ncbi:hypothetical protein G9A89_010615 [Geosiphon pyriformis]|nr:hypothetical protein G9A89_010615 [Geosiphon pyriformis]
MLHSSKNLSSLRKRGYPAIKRKLEDPIALQKVQVAAWYASLAYCLDNSNLVASGIHASALVDNDQIIVFIRGEEFNERDWLQLPIVMTDYPYGRAKKAKVNEFFYKKFQATNNHFSNTLNSYIINSKIITGVIFVGHSLGGGRL